MIVLVNLTNTFSACREANYEECINNVCSGACDVITVPEDWQAGGALSIRFAGSTKCWMCSSIDGGGEFQQASESIPDVWEWAGFAYRSIQCWRKD